MPAAIAAFRWLLEYGSNNSAEVALGSPLGLEAAPMGRPLLFSAGAPNRFWRRDNGPGWRSFGAVRRLAVREAVGYGTDRSSDVDHGGGPLKLVMAGLVEEITEADYADSFADKIRG